MKGYLDLINISNTIITSRIQALEKRPWPSRPRLLTWWRTNDGGSILEKLIMPVSLSFLIRVTEQECSRILAVVEDVRIRPPVDKLLYEAALLLTYARVISRDKVLLCRILPVQIA